MNTLIFMLLGLFSIISIAAYTNNKRIRQNQAECLWDLRQQNRTLEDELLMANRRIAFLEQELDIAVNVGKQLHDSLSHRFANAHKAEWDSLPAGFNVSLKHYLANHPLPISASQTIFQPRKPPIKAHIYDPIQLPNTDEWDADVMEQYERKAS